MQPTLIILGLSGIILAINLAFRHKTDKIKLYECKTGKYAGIRPLEDWRLMAIELARTNKDSKLSTELKYSTDENLIGLLYLNYGIDLVDL